MMALLRLVALAALACSCSAQARVPAYQVFPSGAAVPENLSRIELRFGSPIPHAPEPSSIKLERVDGSAIENAILDVPLLSADGRRLALLLNPARLKTGLEANRQLTRALHDGETVVLRIEDPGTHVMVHRSWRVTAADVVGPRPREWVLETPAVGKRGALVVRLEAAISASAESLIAVRDMRGRRVAGATELLEDETLWRFVPRSKWLPGANVLVIHPDLEDAAGNRSCSSYEGVRISQSTCGQGHSVVIEFAPTERK